MVDQLLTNKVVVATNGYTDESLHPSFANRMMPVLSNIIVTREMSDDEFKLQNYKTLNPICNSREIYIIIEGCLLTECCLVQEVILTVMMQVH